MAAPIFNFNVGVLGHVDSGKTSLSRSLSTTASTACFDKNPQSKERGITLDLGFSSVLVDIPEHLKIEKNETGLLNKYEKLQFTFVDCPGHASLIRTIIGGAQIIDLMLLVVDVTKGIQTQTAECLIIGEIACEKMIVVLNKTDLLPPEKKATMIEKMKKRLLKTLEPTKFANCPIVAVAAKPGGPESTTDAEPEDMIKLLETLKQQTYIPKRNISGPFIFSVDHCFSIRGQGTVMTGTVISGTAAINDTVEIPLLKISKKVKSIQMFRKAVEKVVQGDRAGICLTQFDPKLFERGLVCSPGALPTICAGIVSVSKIRYFKGCVATNAKFHITMGHETVMAHVTFFGYTTEVNESPTQLDLSRDFVHQDELLESISTESEPNSSPQRRIQFALLEFEKAVTCCESCLVIGSKLDSDINANVCRIAFNGVLLKSYTNPKYRETELSEIKIFKTKSREGQIERVNDAYTLIAKNLFKKETNLQAFTNLKVKLSSGETGIIEGGFGQSGKVKIHIPNGLSAEVIQKYTVAKKKGKDKESGDKPMETGPPVKIILTFKRYIFDPKKRMIQS